MDVKRPIITEKSMGLAGSGWYTFAVDKHSRKEALVREIEKMYHVNVLTIRTVAMHGKVRRTGKKMVANHRPDWKKAIVQVKQGQHIDAFDVTNKEPAAEAPKEEVKKEVKSSRGRSASG